MSEDAKDYGARAERSDCTGCKRVDQKVAVFGDIRLCDHCLVDLANAILFTDIPEAPDGN